MSTKLASAFLDRVVRSGLIGEDKLPPLRQQLEECGVDLDDPRAVADGLVEFESLTRWQADKLLEGKHKGFFLGSYRLLRPLGKGGMGAVYLAQHEMMRRQCAIKVLPHSQIKEGSSVLQRFYVEAQAVASLDHQNIVRAYDVNKEVKDGKELHYLVMEYVEGQDVQGLVQDQGVLDPVKAADFLRQTANGLTHAHENGLVHRDIKPANLLVDKRGVVKILDLGLARFFDDSGQASLTQAHNETVLGTADYLSPEQALNSHTVDHRTDIYSLGCTAYFMLTGHPPFPEGTVAQRLIAHQVKTPTPIREERPAVPAGLVTIVDRMMAKNADERFQTATDLVRALTVWLLDYGGDDWKRQHSEIAGDRVMASLLTNREPTRAMSSPMSETELDFAPMDEDGEKAPGQRAAQDAARQPRSPARPKKTAPLDHIDELAPLEEDEQPAPAASAAPPALAAEPVSLDRLDEPALPAWEQLAPLPDLQHADLTTLDEHDLLGTTALDDPLGAIESDLQKVASSSTTSGLSKSSGTSTKSSGLPGKSSGVSKTQRRVQPASPPPKTAWQTLTSVGLPIVIGVGAGLLLVLLLLLFFFLMPGSQRIARAPQGTGGQAVPAGPPPATSQPGTPEQPKQVPSPPQAVEPVARPPAEKITPSKPDNTPPQTKIEPPKSGPPGTETPKTEPSKTETPKPQTPPSGTASTPQPKATQPAPTQPNETAPKQTPVQAAKPEPEPVKTPTAPTAEPGPAPQQASPQELFAKITDVYVSLDTSEGADAKPGAKRKSNPVIQQIMLAVAQKARETVVERCKLNMTETDKAVFYITLVTQVQGDFGMLTLKGEVKCKDEAGNAISVWAEASELTKFNRATDQQTVYRMAHQEMGSLFTKFKRAHDEAKAAHP